MSSSVMRVVLTDGTKQNIIQPLTNENSTVESNSALRSYTPLASRSCPFGK